MAHQVIVLIILNNPHSIVSLKNPHLRERNPTAASNVLLDFDVLSATATLAYDGDVAGESDVKTLFAAGGNCAKGKTIQDLDVESPATSGDKVYLCDGATSTGADTFTAGKLVLTFKAYKSF